MKAKTLNVVLAIIALATSASGFYAWSRMRQLEKESEEWKAKYEEAIIDAEEAVERVQKLEKQLEDALREAETQKQQALQQLEQARKNKSSR
ncbi:MAG: hypothetical protein N2044_03650 [Cyclobacteriaceae bacterium]|nr:hypothetical protein [Cyclobacteriaceae bacterium]MCX7636922.1 hypothetical protein [Cyclobacteriaceae bacterium]